MKIQELISLNESYAGSDGWSDEQWAKLSIDKVVADFRNKTSAEIEDFAQDAWLYDRDDISKALESLIKNKPSATPTKPPVNQKVDFDTTLKFYRGMSSNHDPLEHRSDYAIFVTTNIDQAATYAGPDGRIAEITLDPTNAQPVTGGIRFSPSNFDDVVRTVAPGTVLIAHDVVDSGPFANQMKSKQYTYGSTHVAFRDASIATVIRILPSKEFFS